MPQQTHPRSESPWPNGLSQPAIRALMSAGYTRLEDVAGSSEATLAALHGMGPKGIRIIKQALADASLRPLEP